VLPKLRGDDTLRFREALDAAQSVLNQFGLGESAAKVGQLRSDLAETGSARFWR
jgi:hypothetical protein